jgi:hypothetical protein
MSFLKDLQKFISVHHILALVGLLILGIVVMQYSSRKGTFLDTMDVRHEQQPTTQQHYPVNVAGSDSEQVSASFPVGQNETYATVGGESSETGYGLPPSCSRQPVVKPEELLPRDENSQWAQLNPRGSGDLNNVNLLQAGYLTGINTVGSSLRNANLQLRSEPPNPQVAVSPWMNSTIEPDLMRVPLELGSGAQ